MPDPVVHFEIPADDVERAQHFYGQAFGWKVNAVPGMGYTLFHTAPTDANGMVQVPGAINGGMARRQGPLDRLLITVQVADMEKAIKAVEKGGGRVIRPGQPIPGVGIAAYVKDTEGNTIGLIQPTR